MGSVSNELVFRLGLALAGTALAAFCVLFVVARMRWKKLNEKLDAEYGPVEKRKHG